MPRLLPSLAIAAAAALSLPFAASADSAGKWSGSGEFGFASSRGNTHSENLNAKLSLGYQDDTWKDDFFLNMLRAKGEVKTPVVVDGVTTGYDSSFDMTANRVEAGASSGYKFNPRSYVVGALRYDQDDFAANSREQVASMGFGYIALKDASSELSFEIGPGYKLSQPKDYTVVNTALTPPTVTQVHPAAQTQAIGRGLVNFKHRITDNTSFEDTLLTESGTQNTFYQNEAGVAVAMTKTLALKLGYETRYTSEIAPGAEHSDQLFTTNLVYSFRGSK